MLSYETGKISGRDFVPPNLGIFLSILGWYLAFCTKNVGSRSVISHIYIYICMSVTLFGGPFWVSRCQEIEGDVKNEGEKKTKTEEDKKPKHEKRPPLRCSKHL